MAEKNVKGLVIVESPAKARKIGGYLGARYKVMACIGHVRDLPASASEIPEDIKKKEKWATLGVNVDSGFEPLYVVSKGKEKVVRELKQALRSADELIIATDEDREGESIGWHLTQILQPKVPVKRMVFSEITQEAIRDAIAHPRTLDENLVAAQETRRVVDRLYGYTLSPLLWKKIARGLSAGRVQSVAVRLLVQRELERLAFRKGAYWDLKAALGTAAGAGFDAQLHSVAGVRIASGRDFDEHTGRLKPDANARLLDEPEARALVERLAREPWSVASVESRQQTRRPYPPFTTSTLQQEANRKLGFSAQDTMRTAQRLYEDGYITYMRTDSVNLSGEAIGASRRCVTDRYGTEYLHPEVRQFATRTKNAQEAHEAIRPAGTEMKTADELGLSGREAQLYAMIWKRTVATQMAEARLRFDTAVVAVGDAEFRATGRHVEFPGFFRAYVEGVDDPESALDDQEAALPPLGTGERLDCRRLEPLGHETKPPARYTEATLVRTLEADGIGRPSTYASIIATVQDRGYVRKQGNQLAPTFTAMAVTRLLETYFPRLVDVGFTASMEQTLDDISNGEADRLPYLNRFYHGDEGLDHQVKAQEEAIDPRAACTLNLDGLPQPVRIGRFGPYLEVREDDKPVTVSLPGDLAPADIDPELAARLIELKQKGPESLGNHPEQGLPVYLKNGPFGPYLQLGDFVQDGPKPKRVGIPKNIDPAALDLPKALDLLELPRRLGTHPETGKVVTAGIGRFGPYVLHDKVYKSFDKDHTFTRDGQQVDVLSVDLDTAVEMLKQARQRSAPAALREIGPHPDDQAPIQLFEGRYGPYVKHGDVNATVPKDQDPQTITIEEAVQLLAERAARGPSPRRGRRRTAGPAGTGAAKKTAKKSPDAAAKTAKKKAKKKSAKKKAKRKTAKKAKSAPVEG